MPYNPSSAYPRHTTYTPPVEGRGFARGFNQIDWRYPVGPGAPAPGVDIHGAMARAARPPTQEGMRGALTAMNRQGVGSTLQAWMVNRPAALSRQVSDRMVWNRAEYGDDINEMKDKSDSESSGTSTTEKAKDEDSLWIPTAGNRRPPRERESTFPPSQTGGRAHVGGINDRIDAINDRVTRTSAMNDTVSKVFSGKAGGPMKAVNYVFGAARSRSRRGGRA